MDDRLLFSKQDEIRRLFEAAKCLHEALRQINMARAVIGDADNITDFAMNVRFLSESGVLHAIGLIRKRIDDLRDDIE